ncbi:hypothetical protein Ae331Ps2_2209 [Pseudonocardia sp. Ae331_Ps2]|nr:hypothetical protein Ae331Ps2_2209 [Pseudonocardia sp. Ae331_Ps2]
MHTTSAPLFVTGEDTAPEAVVVVHGEPGIDAGLEADIRTLAAGGRLVVVPYLYFRDGGPDYPQYDLAEAAFARLDPTDVDADVDGAVDHLTGRLGFDRSALRLAATGGGRPGAARAAHRLGLPDPLPLDRPHHADQTRTLR